MNGETVKRLYDRALCAVFPRRCLYCGVPIVPERAVCDDCCAHLPRISAPICPLCGHQKADCVCKQHKLQFKAVCAPFYYEDAIRTAVYRYKFENKDFLAAAFARDMAETVRREYAEMQFDCMTFVPFTKKQLRAREWNPGETLAHALSKELDLPCCTLLEKLYETESQHTLSARARTGNVFGVFEACNLQNVQGKTVLLVDDIKTTGATLSECAKMLKFGGAEAVYTVTFAVTRHKAKEKRPADEIG